MVNVERLEKNLDHIYRHPEQWDQSSWAEATTPGTAEYADDAPACGTAFCLVGHAVVREGYELEWSSYVDSDGKRHWSASSVKGTSKTVSQLASELLDLPFEIGFDGRRSSTYRDVSIFSGANTLRNLYETANEYSNGKIKIPDDVDSVKDIPGALIDDDDDDLDDDDGSLW